MQIIALFCFVFFWFCVLLFVIFDQHAKKLAQHRQWDAHFEAIPVAGWLQSAEDSRFVDSGEVAVFPSLDTSSRDRPWAGCGNKNLVLVTVRPVKAFPDAIAESARVQRARALSVIFDVLVLNVAHHVPHAFKYAGDEAKAMLAMGV